MTAATLVSLVEAEAHLADLLDDLGDTELTVGCRLRAAGATGRPNDVTSCAVADYLTRLGVMFTTAKVTDGTVEAYADGLGFVWVRTPEAVGDFITAFDDNLWPQLVTPAVTR